ncbi:phage baseplate assembly protein V [Enterobacteriaceae bacterium LUAb1]
MSHITLKIAGQPCVLGIGKLCVQQQINAIPSAHIELCLPVDKHGAADMALHHDVSRFTRGASVEIAQDNIPLFRGYLVQKRMMLRGKNASVRLEARHALQKLTFLPRNRVFHQQDDHSILNNLLQAAGVRLTQQAAAQLSSRHDQLIQFRLSDWQFIRSRLLSTNCWMLPDAASDGVVIRSLAHPAAGAQTLERDGHHYCLYEIDLNADSRFTPESLSLQGWDVVAQQLSPGQKSQAKGFQPWQPEQGAEPPVPWQQEYLQTFSYLPEATLKNLSSSWLNYQQMSGLQGRIILAGTRDFRPGENIRLRRFGAGLDGTVLLSGISQRFDVAQGWRTELLVGMAASVLEPIPPVRSLHVATVAEFTADPLHLDRIAIHLPALNLPESVIFARLSKPWASKASGFCCYPEPGDEVVVGFIESDPRYPVILGAMHNPKNTAPFPPDDKNNRKALLVVNNAGQNQALVIDTDQQTVTLSAAEHQFTLTGKEGITVATPKRLQLSAETLEQKAEKSVSVSGKQRVDITSASINMKK